MTNLIVPQVVSPDLCFIKEKIILNNLKHRYYEIRDQSHNDG